MNNAPHNFYGLLDRRDNRIVGNLVGPDALAKTLAWADRHTATGYLSVVALDDHGQPLNTANLR